MFDILVMAVIFIVLLTLYDKVSTSAQVNTQLLSRRLSNHPVKQLGGYGCCGSSNLVVQKASSCQSVEKTEADSDQETEIHNQTINQAVDYIINTCPSPPVVVDKKNSD